MKNFLKQNKRALKTSLLVTIFIFLPIILAGIFNIANANLGGGSGTINSLPIKTFLGLNDTPNSYLGQAGKTLIVNVAENALEFGTASGGSAVWGDITGTLSDQTDLITYLGETFQPIGTYLTEELDPVFSAWDKDFADITNVPTILTTFGSLANSAGVLTNDGSGVLSWGAGGGSMVYPGTGIAVSTGSAWGTSITDNSANWNTAYGWGNHASVGYLTSSTGLKLDQTTPQAVINGSPIMEGIQFDTTPSTSNAAEGLLRWNSTDGTLDLGMNSGNITQQIGQELFIKVWNDTGSTIPNGSVVYFNGRQGNRPKIVLARGDAEATSMVMGMTTQDIATGGEGFITTFGYVRQIKTDYSTWAEGQPLYLSTTTAGALTNVEPVAPHHSDIVGYVGVVGGPGIGSILVAVNRHTSLEELSDINGTLLTDSGQFPVWNDTAGYFDFTENINNYKQAQFYASTMTVNTGTLNTGTVADLQAVGGTDVNIQEANGADPLRVDFNFSGVTRMTAFTFFGYYAGGSGHQMEVEIYNVGTTNWDSLGTIGSETSKKWYSFPIFNTSSYINSGAVSVRLRHVQTGNVTHALILDYLDVDFGSAGGTTNVSASSVTFIPSGNLSSTNVASALSELDSEKVIGNAAITGATKTKITYDTKGLVTSGADATTADIADSLNKRYVTDANLTVIGNTSGTNTGDQTLSGLGGVPTSRTLTINGTGYDLSADRSWTVTADVASAINSATAKTTPIDGDLFGIVDTAASNVLKKLSWSNIKATLKTYFDTLYASVSGSISQVFNVASLEIGHASDTTLSRVSAGTLAIEGIKIPAIAPSTSGNVMTSNGTDWVSSAPAGGSITYKSGVSVRDMDGVSGTQNIAHGLGKIPSKVKITANFKTSDQIWISTGIYDSNGNKNITIMNDVSAQGTTRTSTSDSIFAGITRNLTDNQVGVISVDATNIIITWTKVGTPSATQDINLLWEAE